MIKAICNAVMCVDVGRLVVERVFLFLSGCKRAERVSVNM